MPGRVVVFGATGYTGRLVTESLVALGVRPVLAARSQHKLSALAAQHGGLETALADVDRPETVTALVEAGDVLVSTVGPFQRYGTPALEAAVARGAHYVDSTGEAPFIRRVFDGYGPRAARRGCVLLTAFGYDFAPGNLAGALALRAAGPSARRVDIGYFMTGGIRPSSGTRATIMAGLSESHHAYSGGRLRLEPVMRRVHRFAVDGRTLIGGSVGASEQLALPRWAPHVQDVNVFLGWLGPGTYAAQAGSFVTPVLKRLPFVSRLLALPAERALRTTGEGPDATVRSGSGSLIVAEAYDAQGRPLAKAQVAGVDGYTLTGRAMAWGAQQLLAGQALGAGARGPVDAFGLEAVEAAAGAWGLDRVEVTTA